MVLRLLSEAADHIFSKAKDRVYRILTAEQYRKRVSESSLAHAVPDISCPETLSLGHVLYPVLEVPPKWRVLKQIMQEIKLNVAQAQETIRKNIVIIFVRDELTQSQLNDYLTFDESFVMDQRYRWFVSQQVAEIKQQLVSVRNAKRQRINTSSSRTAPNDVDSSSLEDETYLGLGISRNQYESLSVEEKLVLHEEKRLHNISGRLSEKSKSNILSETSALDACIANDIMVAPVDDEEDESDFEESQLASKDHKRKSGATEFSSKKKNTNPGIVTSSQVKSSKKGISMRSQGSSEAFDGDYVGYAFDRIKDSSPSVIEPSMIDQNTSTLLQSKSMVIFVTHAEALSSYYNILEEIQPNHVIMYDGDVALIRMIETYSADITERRKAGYDMIPMIKVYYTYYDESAEKHRYVDALTREKRAFESLESLISGGIISSITLPDSLADLSAAKKEDQTIVRDSRLLQRELDFHIDTASSSSALEGSSSNIKRQHNPLAMIRREVRASGGSETSTNIEISKPIVVVDIREFRSALPSLLHAAGYHILPRTLTVGDYVLASEIVVERKGISDLFQSFASGRLYNQVCLPTIGWDYKPFYVEWYVP